MAHLSVFALGTKADKRITGPEQEFEHRNDRKDGVRWREMDLCGADDYGQMEAYLRFGMWKSLASIKQSYRGREPGWKLRSNILTYVPL
jgi:hypothetical protein